MPEQYVYTNNNLNLVSERETGLRMLQEQPSSNSILSCDEDYGDDDILRYTSLRDVISSSSASFRHQQFPSLEGLFSPGMDCSNIAIRNELVKRVASMYLHSSVVVAVPDPNWFQRLSSKAKHWAAVTFACLRPVYVVFARLVVAVSRRMIRF